MARASPYRTGDALAGLTAIFMQMYGTVNRVP